jgi:REP element-mobilizing transposase RayT
MQPHPNPVGPHPNPVGENRSSPPFRQAIATVDAVETTQKVVGMGIADAPGMYPRRLLPGMIFMITRRTVRRTHLLRPDEFVTQFFLYVLAVCAARYGIVVHAVVLMSTHEHLIISDPLGRLSLFLAQLHRLVALGIKIHRKWEGSVWDSEKPSVVELCTPKAVIEKLAYVMANPTTAGLVFHSDQWPGLMTQPSQLGTARFTAKRPDVFFDIDNPAWPAEATLQLEVPRIGLSDDETRAQVAKELQMLEREAQAEEAGGRDFLGPQGVALSSPFKEAVGWEPLRGRNPCFAVGRGQRTAFLRATKVLRDFRRAYREAFADWRNGIRDVLFPPGTYLMRVLHDVRVGTS